MSIALGDRQRRRQFFWIINACPFPFVVFLFPFAVDPFGEQVDWHHLLPQKWRTLFAQANVDIDSAVYGVIMDKENHQALHSAGWNNEWEKFFQTNTNPTAAQVQTQLSAMKNKYSGILRNGWRARWTYGDRSNMAKRISDKIKAKIEARLLKRGGKVCVKKVPLVGTLLVILSVKDQIDDKGWVGELAYSAVDAIPVVNLVLIPFEAKQAYDDFNHEGFQTEIEDAVSGELLSDAVPFEEKVGD